MNNLSAFFAGLVSRLQGFRQMSWVSKATIGVVVVGIIWTILPKSLFHSFNCDLQGERQNFQITDEFFIANQIIVIGSPEDLATVIGTYDQAGNPVQIGSAGVQLKLIEGCDLSYLNTRKTSDSGSAVEPRKLAMRLYEITDNRPDMTVMTVIGLITDNQQNLPIVADPNYITIVSDAGTDPCALPYGGGGGTGGTPFGGTYIPDPATGEASRARDGFMRQWAFGNQGINLPDESGFAGREVQVGVFDASPYQNYRPAVQYIGIAQPSALRLTTINHPGTNNNIAAKHNDNRSHGLFVAGLIHAVAPKSNIHLIRVLNDDGCGETWVLNKALEEYTSRMSAWTGYLDETVINMSLGIRVHEKTNKKDLATLKLLTAYADKQGAIIIASAGNDSPKRDTQGNITERVVDMQIPASDPNVIGVAATNKDGNRSCYSDKGEVAAPGGDGGADLQDPNNACVSRVDSWTDSPGPNGGPQCDVNHPEDCSYFLISLAKTDHGLQYIYWSGTSFAAPLVSGMAALAFEEQEKNQVICLINGGPTAAQDPELGSGIINIGDRFTPTVMQQCP